MLAWECRKQLCFASSPLSKNTQWMGLVHAKFSWIVDSQMKSARKWEWATCVFKLFRSSKTSLSFIVMAEIVFMIQSMPWLEFWLIHYILKFVQMPEVTFKHLHLYYILIKDLHLYNFTYWNIVPPTLGRCSISFIILIRTSSVAADHEK